MIQMQMCIRSQWLSDDGRVISSPIGQESPWTCIATLATMCSLSAEHLRHQSSLLLCGKCAFLSFAFSVLCNAERIGVCCEKWTPWTPGDRNLKSKVRDKKRMSARERWNRVLVTVRLARPCSRFCCPGPEAAP